MQYLAALLDASDLAPHGICLLWRPELVWLHVVSDGVIALAYYSIPLALTYFVWRRRDIAFGWVFWLFAAFILACGTTHIISIWTLWNPDYGLEGLVKAVTALASIATAILLWPLIPRALALPSPAQLARVNGELSVQVRERAAAMAALEQEMRERQVVEQNLRQSQKIEALGHLTGGIAHDFNNMLQVITANMEMLRADLGAPKEGIGLEPARERVANALGAASRAARLTGQLLAFARRQPLEPVVLDLGCYIDDNMTDLLARVIGPRIEIRTVRAPDLWRTLVDPHQLENALINLAINARDAMPAGGKLTLEIANTTLDAAYAAAHPDVLPGDYVMVAVTDTGVGMTPQTVARAFEPFFTTKAEGSGTGLGLSQVHGFAKQSGGHVAIYSELQQGTSVRLYLPRSHAEPDATPAPVEEDEAVGGGETVLVVEDDPAVRRASVDMLAGLGYRVLEADGPAEALALLAGPEPVDLLFSDVVMPGPITARELAARAVEARPHLAVLFTSGFPQSAVLHHGRLDTGFPLLGKPYREIDLARKVRAVLAARRTALAGGGQAAAPPPPPVRGPRSGRPVLVVEDNPLVLDSAVEMLYELGYRSVPVPDAEAALAVLAREPFDLMLADIGLPGKDGYELAAEARQRWPGMRILLVSGVIDRAETGDPMIRYLAKPFTISSLERVLASFLSPVD